MNPGSSNYEHATAALRLSEATKSAILQAALDCIVTIDHRGCVVDWNAAAERTFGYSAAETLGREMSELIVPERFRESHRRGLAHAVASGVDRILGHRIEITARRKNGEEFPVELAITRIAAGEKPLFTGHIRDISQRKRSELLQMVHHRVTRFLAESTTLHEAAPKIIESVCEGLSWDMGVVWQTNVSKKRLACVDVWHRDLAGIEPFISGSHKAKFKSGEGLPGRIWKSGEPQWIPDVASDANFPRATLAANVGLHTAFGFPIRLGTRVLGVMEFFSRDIREPDAEILAMFAVLGSQIGQFIERTDAEEKLRQLNHDLEQRIVERTSELVKTQNELVKALEQEKELSRLKTSFVNLVSHEFRTPLGVIMSSADIIEHYFDRLTPEQRRNHLQDIRHATRQMTALMEEVLLLGRVDAGKMKCRIEPFDLSSFCQRLVDEQLSATNRKCPIQLQLELLSGECAGDEGLLRHIFTNLLSNAVKYSPTGKEILFSVKQNGGNAIFEIADHGIGIAPEDQRRLFETFHRGQNVGEIPGTGLGLVIVKRCVDLHGGSISIASEPGAGTKVEVCLRLFQSEMRPQKIARKKAANK